jgi:hypothetical protein
MVVSDLMFDLVQLLVTVIQYVLVSVLPSDDKVYSKSMFSNIYAKHC